MQEEEGYPSCEMGNSTIENRASRKIVAVGIDRGLTFNHALQIYGATRADQRGIITNLTKPSFACAALLPTFAWGSLSQCFALAPASNR